MRPTSPDHGRCPTELAHELLRVRDSQPGKRLQPWERGAAIVEPIPQGSTI